MYSPNVLCRLGRQPHRLIERLILSVHVHDAIFRCCRGHAEIGLGVARVELGWLWFSSLWLGLLMSNLLMRVTARCQVDVSRLLEVAQRSVASVVAIALVASRVLSGKPIGLVWSRIWL